MTLKVYLLALLAFSSLAYADSSKADATTKYSKELSGRGTAYIKENWSRENEMLEGILQERENSEQSGREFYKNMLNIKEYDKKEE